MQFSSFNQVEVSFYGPNNRNNIMDCASLPDYTPTDGSDHYACWFRYGDDLPDHVAATGSVTGHSLLHFCDNATFDVDVKNDLAKAKEYTVQLVKNLLDMGVERHLVYVFFSGAKGFHVQVPSSLFGITPSVDLFSRVKSLCLQIADGVPIDKTIYDKNRLFRLVNTKNSKSNLYKVCIGLEMLDGDIEDILEYAKRPQPVPEFAHDLEPLPHLKAIWEMILSEPTKNVPAKLPAKTCEVVKSSSAMTISKDSKPCIARLLNDGIEEGHRHNAALRLLAHFIKLGFSNETIVSFMERWATICRPPTDEEDFRQMIRDCRQRGYAFGCNDDILSRFCSSDCHLYLSKVVALEPDQLKSLHFTDTGMAEFAAKLFEGRLLYMEEAKAWLVWDGRKWVAGTPGGLYPFVKGMLQKLVQAAFDCDDSDQKTAMLKELIKFQSFSRQTTVINAMAVLPELIVTSNQLDVDPMLLNCLNGVIDLTTGELVHHDPAYRITRIVNCEYDPEADCPRFRQFLATIFQDNADLIGYVQRFLGYALTGKTTEQVMLFCYGKGANGKTSLLKVLLTLMSDFTASAQAELLMVKDSRSGISNDLARLKGARLVTVNEVQEDARLNEAQIKTLTGGDPITARFLFKEFFEFYPQFKLVLVGNHKPVIRGQDHGIWRRIHLLPFMATVPEDERDPDLLDKLKTELPGILAWAVRGCLQWQESGLKPPKEVVEAVNEYRQSEDLFGQWFNDCCVIKKGAMSKSDFVYNSFVEHSGMNITSHKLTKWLTERGFRQERRNTGRHWVGFDLKITQPLSSEEE